MDDKKQIEEMAKSIDTIYVVRTTEIGEGWLNEILKERKLACAYKLYNAGCRIIPEGAVILMPDKIDEYQKAELNIMLSQARKETAREILNEWADCDKETGGFNLPHIYELAKRYGVEVEE